MNVCDQCNGSGRVRRHPDDVAAVAMSLGKSIGPTFAKCPACGPVAHFEKPQKIKEVEGD